MGAKTKNYSAMRDGNNDGRNVVTAMAQEFKDEIGRSVSPATGSTELDVNTTNVGGTKYYQMLGCSEMFLFLSAIAENIADTATATFTFYRKDPTTGTMIEIYQASKYTATTEAVTAGQCEFWEVSDSDDIFKKATHYSVSLGATITVPASGTAFLEVGKYQAG